MEIQYENGLPKGYLKKRKTAGIIYILSIYLYCLFLLLTKLHIMKLAGNNTVFFYIALIFVSGCLLCYSVISGKNYKGIRMYNYKDVKAFTVLEKLLYAIPMAAAAVFFPLDMLYYVMTAGVLYLVVGSVE